MLVPLDEVFEKLQLHQVHFLNVQPSSNNSPLVSNLPMKLGDVIFSSDQKVLNQVPCELPLNIPFWSDNWWRWCPPSTSDGLLAVSFQEEYMKHVMHTECFWKP